MLMLDPSLKQLLTLNDDVKCAASNTENSDPCLITPWIDRVEPSLATARILVQLANAV
jgi:hypothetical protein